MGCLDRLGPCRACLQPGAPNGKQSVAVTSLTAMKRAAESGCVSCGLLTRGVRLVLANDAAIGRDAADGVDGVRVESNVAASGRSLELFVLGVSVRISVFAYTSSPWLQKTLPTIPVGYPVPSSTSSQASLHWLQACLARCLRSHPSCLLRRKQSCSMPTRVIDVGVSDGDVVRLQETHSTDDSRYTCLSHCWGTQGLLRTTLSNLRSHQNGIRWTALPPTYREAIQLVRRLGVRYLWIDSICIIQDDDDDWRREAANMADVYQNAHLVLSASKSVGPGGGLFADLEDRFSICTLSVPEAGENEPHEICFRRSLAHIPGFLDHRLAIDSPFPTFSRGWIFQERFLSPRVVHFGPQELLWECLEESACQCSSQNDPGGTECPRGGPGNQEAALERVSRPKAYYNEENWRSLDAAELLICWHRLVEDYSKLRLTYAKDVFPAISGIAKSFRRVTDCDYFAGLWERTFLSDMVWHAHDETGLQRDEWSQRPQPWRAPTWSWASVKCPVEYIDQLGGFIPLAKILSVQTTPSGPDETGELTAGHVVLRGQAVSMTISYQIAASAADVRSWKLLDLEIARGRVCNVWTDYNLSLAGPDHVPTGTAACGLLLGEKSASGALEVMLLKATREDLEGKGRCVYERIGLLEISKPPGLQLRGLALWDKMGGGSSEEKELKII